MGRPKAVAQDVEKQVEQLAAINCSWQEIANVLGMGEKTVRRRFDQAHKKGVSVGHVSLKRKMWEHAMGGNTTMMIWLSKQMLGYTDKVEERSKVDHTEKQIIQVRWADEHDIANASPDTAAEKNQPIN